MSLKNKALPIQMALLDSSQVSAVYSLLSYDNGVERPLFYLRIVNDSDEGITVSFDGINDHAFVRMQSDWEVNFQTNAQPNNSVCALAQGTQIWIKGTAGDGTIYLNGFYQPLGA